MEIDLEQMAKSLPPEAMPVLQQAGYFEPDRLEVGMRAPRLALTARADGRVVETGGGNAGTPALRSREGVADPIVIGGEAGRPTALIFGSYT